jgi:coproporphyrinogen III oxidase-like Fe-S oxidoreductase
MHLPESFKPQRHISTASLPKEAAKMTMQTSSMASLPARACPLGMDHYALPTDAGRCQTAGRFRPYFQGYSTQPDW